jgi:hypothetical protein
MDLMDRDDLDCVTKDRETLVSAVEPDLVKPSALPVGETPGVQGVSCDLPGEPFHHLPGLHL